MRILASCPLATAAIMAHHQALCFYCATSAKKKKKLDPFFVRSLSRSLALSLFISALNDCFKPVSFLYCVSYECGMCSLFPFFFF